MRRDKQAGAGLTCSLLQRSVNMTGRIQPHMNGRKKPPAELYIPGKHTASPAIGYPRRFFITVSQYQSIKLITPNS